jgi:hypothetical protein
MCNKRTKDSSDEWYNMPSDSDDSDDNMPAPTFTLSLCLINAFSFTFTTFIMFKVVKKEQKTQLRVKDRRVSSVGFRGRGGPCAPHEHLLDATAHASPHIKTIKLSLKK